MNTKEMDLSLNGETFADYKEDWYAIVNKTVGNMQMKGARDAVVTAKLMIHLETENRHTPDGVTEMVIPQFKHDITSVMQVKDKLSGQMTGDYQLVWDDAEQCYVMRPIDDGQMSFDDTPEYYDAEYSVAEDDEDTPKDSDMLEQADRVSLNAHEEEEEDDYQYDSPED